MQPDPVTHTISYGVQSISWGWAIQPYQNIMAYVWFSPQAPVAMVTWPWAPSHYYKERCASTWLLHSLISVSTFVPSEHWPSSYYLTPNDHQVACIFLVLINPGNQMCSFKMALSALVLFTPGSRRSISVCKDIDSTEKWPKEIPRTLTGKVLKFKLQW